MDVKAVGNVQTVFQSHTHSADVVAKEVQKTLSSQESTLQQDESAQRNPSAEEIASAIKEIQEKINVFNGDLEITKDEASGMQVVKIVDTAADKVIRQIPSETVLKIAAYLDEIAGLLYNEKV